MAVGSSPVVSEAPETGRRHQRLLLRNDPVAVTGATLPQVLFSLRIGSAVAFFLALAAVDHLLVASPGCTAGRRRLARPAGC